MTNFKNIQNKLEAFIRRYYTNELLKGAILFFAIGVFYFLLTLFIEHVLWLGTAARAILFWLFIAVEIGLLAQFIFMPLAKLFKLQKGIDYKMASKLIGNHFPEVHDKLFNVLQLNEHEEKTELLLASIDQKSLELNPIPFKLAVNLKKNIEYLKYAAIPVVIILVVFSIGNFKWFSDSYKRVVDYKTAYEPPAPFQFYVVNDSLNALENKDFKLFVKTAGRLSPENVQITYNNEIYFLEQKGVGEFEYVFSQPKEPIVFQLSANNVFSKSYTLNVVKVPTLLSFQMTLEYPNYIKKQTEILKNTGNALVPEGTTVTWELRAKATDMVHLYSEDTLVFNYNKVGVFKTSKQVFNNLNYRLSTGNKQLENYENLDFAIKTVKDEYPELRLKVEQDSLDLQSLYFYGQVSDDYGFSKLQMVYYPSDNESDKQVLPIAVSNSNVSEFISAFPNQFKVDPGVSYDLYFQVFDNDEFNAFKSVKSATFTYKKRTKGEEADKQLKEQTETIKGFDSALNKFSEREKELQALTKTQKEKSRLNYNDKKKLESFFKRQEEQDAMMKNFNEKLKKNLNEFQKDNPIEDVFKEVLKKRLKENEEKLKRDEKLLDEIKRLHERLSKEKLIEKLDDLAKQNKTKKRSLEQLLELTKRFYIEKKLEKLKDDLEKLAIDQEDLSKKAKEENTKENQEQLNKSFDSFKKQLEALEKDAKVLKKPIDIPRDVLDENEIDKEQQIASDQLRVSEDEIKDADSDDNDFKKAQQSQKKAAQKIKALANKMKSAMQSSGGEQTQEDAAMLRQVLDNLVLFSFDQEALMKRFISINVNHNKFASYLVKQNNLRENFEHIDDSLFALSLRQPKLSEPVNKEISEVFYNMDKALEHLAQNDLYQGVSSQQFAFTAANNLADILSSVLDNMQENMNMSAGKGGEADMQMPDIIMSQEELNKMMDQGVKAGEKGKQKERGGKEDEKGEKNPDKEGRGQEDKGGLEGSSGSREGGSASQNALLYQIYKQQQVLRHALEERLAKDGKKAGADGLVEKMEAIEMDLLNKGFTDETYQKMMDLKHQLLKMEHASLEQGEDSRRKANTSQKLFENQSNNQIPTAKQYFKTTEILNRQTLPLRQIYKKKVQDYFKKDND
ncbi:hypothetical protein ACFFU9_08580 [Mariniflexile ostreae]|uniref:Glutamyl-tRNA synthetase n=1 Tax=Mariniflexile ostreae TaxID=1520892 RepID=A0ABV5FBH8_9FLAO